MILQEVIMELYIMRHGETDWNKAMRMQGQVNIQLNDYGRELAVKTKEGLKDIKFDYVYSSPLDRAIETAKIVTGYEEDRIIKDERLREISFGIYEGKYPDERPPEFMDFFKAPDKYIAPDRAESYEQLCSRTEDFIRKVIFPLAEKEPEAKVLISGHGAMNKSLILFFKKLEIKDIWSGPFQKNCCISLINIKNSSEYQFVYENKIFYQEKEYKPLWMINSIHDDDCGCEEKTDSEVYYIVYAESEKGEKKQIRLSNSFIDKNGILEGRYVDEDILFGQ